MTADQLSFELKNDLVELNTLCRHLAQFGNALGLPKKAVFELNLALDELFTNIVSYGFKDDAEHVVKFKISHANGLLDVRVEDDGIPFNLVETAGPDVACPVENRQLGGLGIYLIKRVMNEIIYERRENRNILILKKTV